MKTLAEMREETEAGTAAVMRYKRSAAVSADVIDRLHSALKDLARAKAENKPTNKIASRIASLRDENKHRVGVVGRQISRIGEDLDESAYKKYRVRKGNFELNKFSGKKEALSMAAELGAGHHVAKIGAGYYIHQAWDHRGNNVPVKHGSIVKENIREETQMKTFGEFIADIAEAAEITPVKDAQVLALAKKEGKARKKFLDATGYVSSKEDEDQIKGQNEK